MASAVPLSSKDAHILSLLSLPTPVASESSNSTHISSTSISPPTTFPTDLPQKEVSILAPLNTASPTTSAITRAISELTAIINLHPTYASAYNNRAQANRLLHGSDIYHHSVHDAEIWTDLTTAITLSAPASGSEVQEWQRKVLASAHTQRAWLAYTAAKNGERTHEDIRARLPEELNGLYKEELEAWCAKEFEKGAKYGNEMAKEMARATNPYAKLCGSIVGEMIARESNVAQANARSGTEGSH